MGDAMKTCPNCGNTGVCSGTGYLVAVSPDGDELRLSPEALAAAHAACTRRAQRMHGTRCMQRMLGADIDLAALTDAGLATELEARAEVRRIACERYAAAFDEWFRRLQGRARQEVPG